MSDRKPISFFDIIWRLEDLQKQVEQKQTRKNLTISGQCKLDDEWIHLHECIDFLRTEQCKAHGWPLKKVDSK